MMVLATMRKGVFNVKGTAVLPVLLKNVWEPNAA